ncbi:MAG: hypothetical protein RJA07_543 [Bacteroidota bacterium]
MIVQPQLLPITIVKSIKKEAYKMSCCDSDSSHHSKSEKKSKSCCEDKTCNPFSLCSCCNGYAFEEKQFDFICHSVSEFQYQKLNLFSHSDFNSAAFRPPNNLT